MDKTITIKLSPFQCSVMKQGAYTFDDIEFPELTKEELKFWDIKFIKKGKEFNPDEIKDTFGKGRLVDLNFMVLSKAPNKNELACSMIVPKSKELLKSIMHMVDTQRTWNLDTYPNDTVESRIQKQFDNFEDKLKNLIKELFEFDFKDSPIEKQRLLEKLNEEEK